MVTIDTWRGRIGGFSCRGLPSSNHACINNCMMCELKRSNASNCSGENRPKTYSKNYVKACEESLVTKSNHATVIDIELVRAGVETHPGPGSSNLVSTFISIVNVLLCCCLMQDPNRIFRLGNIHVYLDANNSCHLIAKVLYLQYMVSKTCARTRKGSNDVWSLPPGA